MQGFELLLAHGNNVHHLLKPFFLPLSLLLCGRQGHLQNMQGGWQMRVQSRSFLLPYAVQESKRTGDYRGNVHAALDR